MKTIGLIIKADELSEKTAKSFCDFNEAYFYNLTDENLNIKPDAIACFGGDGTFLRAVRYAIKYDVPVISVNSGQLGFLSGFGIDDREAFKKAIIDINPKIDCLSLFAAKIFGADGKQSFDDIFFLNEITVERPIGQGQYGGITSLSVSVNGQMYQEFDADGVIVASSVGSTAYSLSAGGSILSPDLNAMIITPVCSHSLSARPLVVRDDSTVTVKLGTRCRLCAVYADGLYKGALTPDQKLEIRLSSKKIYTIKGNKNFYAKILKWGDKHV